jgi:hypothetical protein
MKYCQINIARLKNLTIIKKDDGLQEVRSSRVEIVGKWERSGLLDGLVGLKYDADYSDNYVYRGLVEKVFNVKDNEGLRTKIREIVRSHS